MDARFKSRKWSKVLRVGLTTSTIQNRPMLGIYHIQRKISLVEILLGSPSQLCYLEDQRLEGLGQLCLMFRKRVI
ncbi:MAG: hypothetical protein DWH73_02210 [Planctomycetota bacterium]|nr:MAG: hypothetical protein DWH73_02210 [Planctomycetota bacterium]